MSFSQKSNIIKVIIVCMYFWKYIGCCSLVTVLVPATDYVCETIFVTQLIFVSYVFFHVKFKYVVRIAHHPQQF
jgi:uncharacterized membrane protein YkvI